MQISALPCYNYPGVGETNNYEYSYSQAVHIGDIVKCFAQGGCEEIGNIDADDLSAQIAKAFQKVEKTLQIAGLRGWENVYSVRSYHISVKKSFNLMVRQLKESMPHHQPIWTCVGVGAWNSPDNLRD